MKSSTRRMRWFMITLFIVLMALCLGLSMFFIACKGGSADDEEEKENPSGEPTVTVTAVTISGPEDNELEVGKTLELTATVTTEEGTDYTGSVTWESSSAAVATVSGTGATATVTGVAEGETNITATAGGVTSETYTVNIVPATSSEPVYDYNAEESFIVPMTSDGATASSESFTTGNVIVSNTLFTVSALDDVKYHIGSEHGNINSGNYAVSFTDMSGTSHSPDQGLESGTNIGPTYNDTTAGWDEGFQDEIYKIEALEDATVYVYLTLANDSYNSNRTGTIYYSINGETKVSENTSRRDTVVTLELTLSAGDVVLIGASNSTTSTKTDESTGESVTSAQNARLWLFGVEAKAKEGGNTGSGSGTTEDPGSSGTAFEEIEGYEWVSSVADIASAIDATGATSSGTKGQSEVTVGRFSFPSGMYYEDTGSGITGSYDVNTQGNNSITVELTGAYNNISFSGRSAASGNADMQVGIYLSGSSTALYEWTLGSSVSTCNYNTSTGLYLEKGTYLITTSAAARLADITAYEYVEQSDPKEITAEISTADFLYGRNISESDLGLIVTLVYENGREDLISSGYSTDLSTLQGTSGGLQLGANEITVTYSPNGGGQEFSCKVTIYLYELESIEISDFSMAYTGGTYYTNNVQKIYLTGDTVSYDYAAVTATAGYGTGADASEATFILTSSEVHFSTADASGNAVEGAFTTTGTYTVTATVDASLKTGDAVTATYDVNVVSAEGADATQVKVNGTATSITMDSAGVYTVTTINDAIQLIKLLGAPDSVRKTVTVAAGQYWEKIYIDIPNLSLIGANSAEETALATRQDSASGGTEIVYWAFNGLMDPSGTTTFSTVGSATVTVAKEAVGFYAANITFRNYWNTNDLYNQCKEINSNTQADAAYINADKSYFYNVTFTGYHDTLEAENGRQYYDHCYIEGRTDYIFGNTATAYFSYCTVNTIGAGTDQNNGGYVVATKGGTSAEHVGYGYIFANCKFTGDSAVKPGSVSIARGWDSYMTIAIINCELDGSYSTEGYGNSSSSLNDRYTKMNADPVASQLYEYGNTGAGAVTVDGTNYVTGEDGIVYQVVGDEKYPLYTALTEDTMKDFLDFTKIFAAVNGSYKYNDDWSGASVEIVTATVTVEGETYKVTGYKGSLSVADVIATVNELLSGQEIETLYGADSQPVDGETKITEDVTFSAAAQEADMTVPSSVTYDFNGKQGDSTETLEGWYGYLYIDLGESNGSFASNQSGWYLLSGSATITVKISAGTTISVQMYEADAMAVNGTTVTGEEDNGTYWYTYTATSEDGEELVMNLASGKSQLFIRAIEINVPITYRINDVINLVGVTESVSIQNGTGVYKGIEVDATASGSKFANNSNSFEIGAGTILKIQSVPGASAELVYYPNYDVSSSTTIETDEDGVITITFTEHTYVETITITDGSAT